MSRFLAICHEIVTDTWLARFTVPSRLSRPSSAASLGAPGTPTRSSRLSVGPSTTAGTPQQSAKLAELKSMFGVAEKE